jgi:hypothetical protein
VYFCAAATGVATTVTGCVFASKHRLQSRFWIESCCCHSRAKYFGNKVFSVRSRTARQSQEQAPAYIHDSIISPFMNSLVRRMRCETISSPAPSHEPPRLNSVRSQQKTPDPEHDTVSRMRIHKQEHNSLLHHADGKVSAKDIAPNQ